MKASNPFKEAIKSYLEKRASEDKLFAETYKKENKNLDECCNYVMSRAKQGGFNAYSPEEVIEWAVHYYDEDDIKNVAPVKGLVQVANKAEKPIKKPTKKETTAPTKDAPKKAAKKKEEPINQISMFDSL